MRAPRRPPQRFMLPAPRGPPLPSSMAPMASSTIRLAASLTATARCRRPIHPASASTSTLRLPNRSQNLEMANEVKQGSESAFAKSEYDQRTARARKLLSDAGIDVMVVTGPENIFYLTGQQTPGYYTFQALVLPVEGEPAFVVRQLEYFNFIANTFIANAEVYGDGDQPVNFLVNVIKARGWASKRIAIDKRGWFLPIATYEALQDKLGAIHDGAGIIEQLR